MRPMQVSAGKRAPIFDEGSLDQYLRDISKYPLIDKAEEVRLAQGIHVGDEECLDKMVILGERHLRETLRQYLLHYNYDRTHQGIGNRLIVPKLAAAANDNGPVRRTNRIGGLLSYYHRDAP